MAGRGSRFQEKGYVQPKYEIEVNEKSLFEWSLESLRDLYNDEFIFICLKENNAYPFIKEKCEILGINRYKILEIDSVTLGQAETAYKANGILNDNEEVIIYNIDTHVNPNVIKRTDFLNESDGVIPVFKAIGDNWSYVQINQNNIITLVEEKVAISDLASIGLYHFRKWSYFKECYLATEQLLVPQYKEKYISPLYNYLIKEKKCNIKAHIIPAEYIIPIGTPLELKKFEVSL